MPAIANIIGVEISILINIFLFIDIAIDYLNLGIALCLFVFLGLLVLALAHVLLDHAASIAEALADLLLAHGEQTHDPIFVDDLPDLADANLVQVIEIKVAIILGMVPFVYFFLLPLLQFLMGLFQPLLLLFQVVQLRCDVRVVLR